MAESVAGLLPRPITQAEIELSDGRGGLPSRRIYPEWIKAMRAAFDQAKEERGSLAQCHKEAGAAGEFYFDVDVWRRLAPFRDFVLDSPAGRLAATLMKSSFAHLFYDQVFIMEPGEVALTPWHQDQPYWQVDGKQVCTDWMPLDTVPRKPSSNSCGVRTGLKRGSAPSPSAREMRPMTRRCLRFPISKAIARKMIWSAGMWNRAIASCSRRGSCRARMADRVSRGGRGRLQRGGAETMRGSSCGPTKQTSPYSIRD